MAVVIHKMMYHMVQQTKKAPAATLKESPLQLSPSPPLCDDDGEGDVAADGDEGDGGNPGLEGAS